MMGDGSDEEEEKRTVKPVLQREAPQEILVALGEWVTKTTDDPQSIVSTFSQ